MLDFLTSRSFAVHLSRDMVVLERDGLLRDFSGILEAWETIWGEVNRG